MITEEMKKQKNESLDAFVAETTNKRSVVEFTKFPPALFCCGILKEPRNHLIKGVNNVVLRVFGVNGKGDRFVQHTSLDLTLEELPYLRECIDDVLSKKPC